MTTELQRYQISDMYSVAFQMELGLLWSSWGPTGIPCFSGDLLRNVLSGFELISNGTFERGMKNGSKLKFLVLRSAFEKVFSLGGDMRLFHRLIVENDRHGLREYAKMSMQLMEALQTGLGCGLTTICVIEGTCFGGGLEAAMACDYIFATRSARFGFPEIKLGIFPGMGAISICARLLDKRTFQRLFHNGETFTAEELHSAGLIDELIDDSEAEPFIKAFVRKRIGTYSAHYTMMNTRKAELSPSPHAVSAAMESWIDCALSLDYRRLLILSQAAEKQR